MLFSISSGSMAGTGSGVTPSRPGRMPSRIRVRYRRQMSGSAACEGLLADGRDRVEAVHEQRLDQLFLGAEPPVDGADADPRMTGDLVQADLEPALVEHLGGCHQDPLPVPLGVPPQWPGTGATRMP